MSLSKKSMLSATAAFIGLSSSLMANSCCEPQNDCCLMDEIKVCAHVSPLLGKICDRELEFATSPASNNIKHQLKSEWEFGVRAGLDFFLPCDSFYFSTNYTYFNNDLDGSASGGNITPHFASTATANSTSATVDRNFHILDLTLNYGECNWCECIALTPYSGMRYVNWNSEYSEVNTGNGFLTNEKSYINRDFDSLGFIWGMDMETCVCSLCDFELVVHGSFGMGYHAADLDTDGQTLINGTSASYADCKCISFGSYEASIGMAADYSFCDTALTLGVNYEFSHWGFNDDDDGFPSSTSVGLDNSTEISFNGFSFEVGYCF